MALSYGLQYVEPSRDSSGKIVAISVYESVTWDGTRYFGSFPSTRAAIIKMQELIAGRACRLNWVSAQYTGGLAALDAQVMICADIGSSRSGSMYPLSIGELNIRGNGAKGYAALSGVSNVIAPNFDSMQGDTGSDTTSESFVMLNFSAAEGAPDNTETIVVNYQIEVME